MSKLSVRKFGVGVASLALVAGVAPLASAWHLPGVGDGVKRLSGDDRVGTSVAVAKAQYGASSAAKTLYVVGYDAVVDGAVSGVLDDPVIIMPAAESAQIALGEKLATDMPNVTKVVAIGGKGVVSDDAMKALTKKWTDVTIGDRIDGANRFETAVNVNKVAFKKSGRTVSNVYLTRGDNIVDALAAGAITDGPVLLVNREGAIDSKVAEYYKSLNKTSDSVIVIGGAGALSDAQVKALVGEAVKVTPWEYAEKRAELVKKIQTAGARYLGQFDWEQGTDYEGLDWHTNDPGDTNLEADGESTVASKISITGSNSTTVGNWFVGYAAIEATTKTVRDNIQTSVTNGTNMLNLQVGAASAVTKAQLGTACANVTASFNSGTAGHLLAASFKNLYGTCDVKYFEFNDLTAGASEGDQTVKGLKASAIATLVKTDKEAGYTFLHDTDPNIPATVPAGNATNTANWVAVLDLAKTAYTQAEANAKAAKSAADHAVAELDNLTGANVVTEAGSGVKRIAGADRFETAALLSIWITGTDTTDGPADVYLASGNDANQVDAVVAGQLTGGSILLVPSTGDLPKSVASELKRLGAFDTAPKLKVVGGTAVITDAMVSAATKAMG